MGTTTITNSELHAYATERGLTIRVADGARADTLTETLLIEDMLIVPPGQDPDVTLAQARQLIGQQPARTFTPGACYELIPDPALTTPVGDLVTVASAHRTGPQLWVTVYGPVLYDETEVAPGEPRLRIETWTVAAHRIGRYVSAPATREQLQAAVNLLDRVLEDPAGAFAARVYLELNEKTAATVLNDQLDIEQAELSDGVPCMWRDQGDRVRVAFDPRQASEAEARAAVIVRVGAARAASTTRT